ncbi:MAG TPA: hypothetical protein VFG73_02535 [Rhodanobacteraceae bacterium]|nr:hypothetical protein [Rhodanobacteraceae bacterium]
MAGILSTEDLKRATGYQRSADVERCLKAAGIRYFPGKEGPWTTSDLVNAAGGLALASNDDSYTADIL